jgi:hypothetical protein
MIIEDIELPDGTRIKGADVVISIPANPVGHAVEDALKEHSGVERLVGMFLATAGLPEGIADVLRHRFGNGHVRVTFGISTDPGDRTVLRIEWVKAKGDACPTN